MSYKSKIKNKYNKFVYNPWDKSTDINNIYSYYENQEKRRFFEEVTNLFNNVEKNKNHLDNLKITTMRSMIINQKPIPVKWILQPNYSKLVNNLLKSPKIISYAIDYNNFNEKKQKELDNIMLNDIYNSQRSSFSTLGMNNKRTDRLGQENTTSKLRLKYGYDLRERLEKDLNRGLSVQNCLNKNKICNTVRKRNEDSKNKQSEIFRTLQNERNRENRVIGKKEFTLPKLVI